MTTTSKAAPATREQVSGEADQGVGSAWNEPPAVAKFGAGIATAGQLASLDRRASKRASIEPKDEGHEAPLLVDKKARRRTRRQVERASASAARSSIPSAIGSAWNDPAPADIAAPAGGDGATPRMSHFTDPAAAVATAATKEECSGSDSSEDSQVGDMAIAATLRNSAEAFGQSATRLKTKAESIAARAISRDKTSRKMLKAAYKYEHRAAAAKKE